MVEQDFERGESEKILIDCVERALDRFGEGFKQVVCYNLKINQHIEGRMLVRGPDLFSDGLFQLFGEGAQLILASVMEEIKSKFEIIVGESDDFEELILKVAQRICLPEFEHDSQLDHRMSW